MKSIYLIPLALLLSLFACKEKTTSVSPDDDPLYLEVMEIHDEVMPEMATIHALKKDLKGVAVPDVTGKVLVDENIKRLDDADEAMMSWMAQFSPPEDISQRKSYLEMEKQRIQAVSDEMWKAINSAKTLLDSLQNIEK